MSRAERRREAKFNAKLAKRVVTQNPWLAPDEVNIKMAAIRKQIDEEHERGIQLLQEYTGDFLHEQLFKAECYMQFGMLLVTLQAIKTTWGNLKTVQNGMDKFIRNLNPAMEYVDQVGIEQAWRELTDMYGLDIGFEDFDINSLWDGISKNSVSAICFKVWEKQKPVYEEIIKEVQDFERQKEAM